MRTHYKHPNPVDSGKWTACGNWTAYDGLTDVGVQFWTSDNRAEVTCKRCKRSVAYMHNQGKGRMAQ